MSVTVHLDLVEGASYTRNRQGKKAVRTAMVEGLEGDPDEILYLASVADGMPAYGSAHPSIPGLYLYEISPESVGEAGMARVRLTYEPPRFIPFENQDPAIVVGATLEQHSTYQDIDETQFDVQYTTGATTHHQTPTASVLRPKMSLELTRRESASPATKAAAYVGTVNAEGWSVDSAAAARTWLCTGIVGRSQDGGETYDVNYTFLYRADPPEGNWDTCLQYLDPRTGRAPNDLDANGRKFYQVYAEANFNLLDLD